MQGCNQPHQERMLIEALVFFLSHWIPQKCWFCLRSFLSPTSAICWYRWHHSGGCLSCVACPSSIDLRNSFPKPPHLLHQHLILLISSPIDCSKTLILYFNSLSSLPKKSARSPCPGCNRHHQDDIIFFGLGDPYKPSFATGSP